MISYLGGLKCTVRMSILNRMFDKDVYMLNVDKQARVVHKVAAKISKVFREDHDMYPRIYFYDTCNTIVIYDTEDTSNLKFEAIIKDIINNLTFVAIPNNSDGSDSYKILYILDFENGDNHRYYEIKKDEEEEKDEEE